MPVNIQIAIVLLALTVLILITGLYIIKYRPFCLIFALICIIYGIIFAFLPNAIN